MKSFHHPHRCSWELEVGRGVEHTAGPSHSPVLENGSTPIRLRPSSPPPHALGATWNSLSRTPPSLTREVWRARQAAGSAEARGGAGERSRQSVPPPLRRLPWRSVRCSARHSAESEAGARRRRRRAGEQTLARPSAPGVGSLCLGRGAPRPLDSPSPSAAGRQGGHPTLRLLAPPPAPSALASLAPAAARLTPPAAPPSRSGRCSG
ncbi:protein FAM246C-like [Balaenoptera ricei]|uniref:protein FAM246C-like n=1 Tax=Balaenoptera ricei TaxID=2746895 RepID=UPI0028BD3DC9|nr:protein FAM246C-like [Balaenoptera ricei]